jgi:hypothetical protein
MKDAKYEPMVPGGNDHVDIDDVDISDALLWSDCPEELYLQRILGEKYGKVSEYDGIRSKNDSLMGDSTVNNLMVENKVPGKVRQWTDWAPIAGSRTTEGGNSEAMTLVSAIRPVEIDFSDEATSPVATNVSSVPEIVQVESEIRIEMDKAGMSTLSGDTGLQCIPEMIVEAATIDMEKTGVSSLSGDTGIQRIQPAADYTHLWIPVEDVTYARPRAIPSPARGRKTSNAVGTPSTQHSSTAFGGIEDQHKGCCGFLRRATEYRLFRRVVNIAVLLLVIFVSLSAAAMIKSTMFNNTTGDPGDDGGGPNYSLPSRSPSHDYPPTSAQEADTASPSTTNASKPTPTLPPTHFPPPAQQSTSAPSQAEHTNTAPAGDVLDDQLVPSEGPTGPPPATIYPTPDFQDDTAAAAARNRIIATVVEAAPDALESLGENSSSQFQALAWLVGDLQQRPLTDNRILQRWVLAVFFFSMKGPEWSRSDGWMTTLDECEWFTTSMDDICDDDGLITRIDLRGNHLGGFIPEEVALLSHSLGKTYVETYGFQIKTNPKPL